jgi:hypothetical protein
MNKNNDLMNLLKKELSIYEMSFFEILNPRWKFKMTKGCNDYYEHKSGKRKVGIGRGYSAIDWEWLMNNES